MNLSVRRMIAFVIDYLIMAIYALSLFGLTIFLKIDVIEISPLKGQVIGFITLTLPVFLYFYLNEAGVYQGTIGKRALSLRVLENPSKNKKGILFRNILKFLPWELAHTGVHWIMFYPMQEKKPPNWVWILLIAPQVLALLYFISILITKGKKSVYDSIANTEVHSTR